MKRSHDAGRRYLAGLVIAFAVTFFVVGTFGPARHSPYYVMIVPLPAMIALFLGGRAWSFGDVRSARFASAALVLLLAVLLLSHLLPRSIG